MPSLRLIPILFLLTLLTGCGLGGSDRWKEKRPATVPVKGAVIYRGYPLAKAMVILQPRDSGGVGASAVTDSEGEFELRSFPPDPGAVPGSYLVAVMKTDFDDPKYKVAPVENYDEVLNNKDDVAPVSVSLIPTKYNDPSTSGLIAEITADGENVLTFELTKE